jgi:rod shape-determining protein MreD
MKIFLFIVVIFLTVVLQISFLSNFEILRAIPNLLLVFIITWNILKNYKNGFFWAMLGGALVDLFSNSLFGINMLSLLITSLFVYLLINNFINSDDIYSRIGLISIATLSYELLFVLFSFLAKIFRLTNYSNFITMDLFYTVFGSIILNSVLMMLLYKFIKLFHNFILRYEERIKART